ncbi:MAG: RNA 2'-phosphotransferase [Planctomycetaceae bacterium]|nr:RNA 2'-phosphotransferase [Planctomycetaceae bacterium]
MDSKKLKRVSKSLSYVLRHRPETVGLTLNDGGWVAVDELIAAFQRSGKRMSRGLLEDVVAGNDKQRFEISVDGTQIRARQGHSVEIDLGYEPAVPPDVLFHGTATRNLDSILAQGLIKGRRHHVHLSTNQATMLAVGQRHGKPVLLTIDAARMHAEGHEFFVTGNDVWLTDHVPVEFISKP